MCRMARRSWPVSDLVLKVPMSYMFSGEIVMKVSLCLAKHILERRIACGKQEGSIL